MSSIALGTMAWGSDTDLHEARAIFDSYLEAGGNLVDTADVYSEGASEDLVGRFAKDVGRDNVVIATKAVSVPGTKRRFDASRNHLLNALDASLTRLGVDHIDLWQLHAWDPLTPLDETLDAVDRAIASGRVRYAGVSNYAGWQLTLAATGQSGAHRLASAQVEYSLLERGIEREVLPAAQHLGVGVMAWSALGRGVLTGKYRDSIPAGSRGEHPSYSRFIQPYLNERSGRIVDAVMTAAQGLGRTPAQVSLAWLTGRPGVATAIVGPRDVGQARHLFEASDLRLPPEIESALDDVSAPTRSYPEFGWNQR